eukprot:2875705-Amphidinium_carterae.1
MALPLKKATLDRFALHSYRLEYRGISCPQVQQRKVRRRSKSPERIPPTDFQDYEPAENGGG